MSAGGTGDPHASFLEASTVPLDRSHSSGTLEEARTILAAHPEVAGASVHVAAVLGDDVGVRRFLERDPEVATAPGGPRGWDPLDHLCFSRWLRLDRDRSDGFVRAATALLDAGADPNGGWWEGRHEPEPVRESVLYGAAGVAHHGPLTRLLLDRGADPEDDEVLYHAPEGHDNAAMEAVVDSGRVSAQGLATMLLRKADWHDSEGIGYLLDRGADPNLTTRWGFSGLHQAVRRDNALAIIERMLDRGADPTLPNARASGSDARRSAAAMGARRGRGDVLDALQRRGLADGLEGVDRLVAACARDDGEAIRELVSAEPRLREELVAASGELLAGFAGMGNEAGLRRLLELGADVAATHDPADGYWGLAEGSTALHVAAWRARPGSLKLLVERGAPLEARDGRGRTPLLLAARACVDSYWTERRSPAAVAALLDAGASAAEVPVPIGYPPVDELLRTHGAPERRDPPPG